jgi:hypothetical protein
MKVIHTQDGLYAIEGPGGLSKRRYYTQAWAEDLARRVAARMGVEFVEE